VNVVLDRVFESSRVGTTAALALSLETKFANFPTGQK
jgi:hypothetical protein